MKLKNVFIGVCILFSTQAWSQVNGSVPELGAVIITDVTRLYPVNNYYDQMQECSDNGSGAMPVQQVNTPEAGAVNTGPGLVLPPSIGNAAGNPDPGVITIQPPGNPQGNNGTPSIGGIGGIGSGIGLPGTGGIILDQIINIGSLAWSIVQSSRPTMRLSTYRAHGLPKGITCWTDLEEWKIPKSKVFRVEQKSKLGQSLAKFTFRISFVHGGSYNGIGQYLANVTVTPVDVQVGWGVDFGSEVHIPSVFNMGKKTNPLAAMQVFVYWNLGSAMKMQQKSQLFHVTGDGQIVQAAN